MIFNLDRSKYRIEIGIENSVESFKMHIVSPSANLNAYFSLIVKNTKQSNPDDSLLNSRLLPLVSYFSSILLNVLMMKNILDKILSTQGVKLN